MVAVDRRARREHSVLRGLNRFCEREGLGASVLVAEVIEAYLCSGLEGRAPSTKGTYHSALRHLAHLDAPKGAPRFSGAPAPAPYSMSERAELYSIASSQRRPWRVRSALALLAFGLGAGLCGAELVAAKGRDVTRLGDVVLLKVRGPRARTLHVNGHEAKLALELAATRSVYLFHPHEADRSYPNFVNDFCRGLVADPSSTKFSAPRARSSFICDHLSAGTALSSLLGATGIVEVESLLRFSVHVVGAPESKAGLRALLASERA
jgi:integrase